MYQVYLTKPAQKELKKLASRFQEKTLVNLRLLRIDPFLGKKMSGDHAGEYRIKIPPVRIIYTIDFADKEIWVRVIGHRGDVYK